MSTLYLLFESSSGYGLFERVKAEVIEVAAVQQDINELKRFSEIVKLKSFLPFTSAENALENINAVSEGEATQFLLDWLQLSLPKASKKSTFELGVLDSRLAAHIKDSLSTPCVSTQLTDELLRGVRLHFTHYIKALKQSDLHQAQLGLSHAYSRSKVKFNVHRVDNMIIQAIALLDQLDKDLNTFTMRVREWYSWHFPELYAIVPDSLQFAQCCRLIQNKSTLTAPSTSGPLLDSLESVLEDGDRAKTIVEAAKMSMGTDISPIDLVNIEQFASRCIELGLYRKSLHAYLVSKMNLCAPNLSALIGEQVGARLISHAGSLTNLAKYPASTVQILGAEKALFRALKTKGNTPKYGLIYHSTFIGRAATKNKGRISRYLANKCSLASRIDSFADGATNVYGTKLREQVEERLEFYKTGTAPKKNTDVMSEAVRLDAVNREGEGGEANGGEGGEKKKKKKDKKDKKRESVAPAAAAAMEVEAEDGETNGEAEGEKAKKKKDKKRKAAEEAEEQTEVAAEEVGEKEAKKAKKEKKKDKKSSKD